MIKTIIKEFKFQMQLFLCDIASNEGQKQILELRKLLGNY